METRVGRHVLAPQPAGRVARGFRLTPVLMVLPAVVVLLAITVFPLVSTLRLTVMSWELTTGVPPQFVGLQNFARAFFQDPRFWNAMMNTGILAVVGVGLQTLIGMGLALELHRLARLRQFGPSLLLIPAMIAPALAGLPFRPIYNAQFA